MANVSKFYLLRLRNASIAELVFRFQQVLTQIVLKFLNTLGFEIPRLPATGLQSVEKLNSPDLYPKKVSLLSEKEEILGLTPASVDGRIKKPNEGLQDSGLSSGSGDIRLVWEPARLQKVVALLVYARQADAAERKKAMNVARRMILSWLLDNPFPRGVHYQSVMECALRVPVFFMALKQIDNLNAEESEILLNAIYRHGWLISKKLSLYSSLGNHTITEAVGLIFAGAVYRSTRRGRDWLERGIKLLNCELSHQILEDGGPAEQSLNYHRFVLDLYLIAMDFIQKNNLGNVSHWQTKLAAGELFLSAFKDKNGIFPSIGDSDDGCAVAPGISPSILAKGGIDKNYITFVDSGYTIIRNDELVFTFDHGPLGMAPFYGHGHADALSITLAKNGHPLLIDPGTYRYNGVPKLRRYFKGTRAHNTVTIDDQDQAIQQTGFIWSKPYCAKLTEAETQEGRLFFSAFHDGYTRLNQPVRHYRSILFFDQANFLIRDRFSGKGKHQFQINFHLHPKVTINQAGKWWMLTNCGEKIFIRLLDGELIPVKGGLNPIMGWFSSRYGEKEPTTVLTFTKKGHANEVTFETAVFTKQSFSQ